MLLRLHHFSFALWLGVLALAVSGVAQNQLSSNVVVAALQSAGGAGGHFMPDGSFMAGPMGGADHAHHHSDGPDGGGHTHKGHADCSVCGVVASMAALSLPVLATVSLSDIFAKPPSWRTARAVFTAAPYAPYASRAPPHISA
jgi:hypothetical protein